MQTVVHTFYCLQRAMDDKILGRPGELFVHPWVPMHRMPAEACMFESEEFATKYQQRHLHLPKTIIRKYQIVTEE